MNFSFRFSDSQKAGFHFCDCCVDMEGGFDALAGGEAQGAGVVGVGGQGGDGICQGSRILGGYNDAGYAVFDQLRQAANV